MGWLVTTLGALLFLPLGVFGVLFLGALLGVVVFIAVVVVVAAAATATVVAVVAVAFVVVVVVVVVATVVVFTAVCVTVVGVTVVTMVAVKSCSTFIDWDIGRVGIERFGMGVAAVAAFVVSSCFT